jgi:hypothetical protein
MTDIDVDKLYDDAMNEGDSEIPMTSEPEVVPEAPAAPQIPELEFTYKNKQIKTKFDDPKLKGWVSQGYDYAQRMQEFTSQQKEFEGRQKAVGEIETKFKDINDWATANPDKWNSLFDTWKKSQESATAPQVQLPPEITQKLEKYDQFIQKLELKEQTEIVQREDSELDAEIKSVREQYPHLDFDAPTHDGKSLEFKVVEYGASKGIKSFADAFYAFNHKNLFKLAEEKGKETVSKDIQKKTKLGLLGKTPIPTKTMSRPDVSNQSYEDILADIKREYNVS